VNLLLKDRLCLIVGAGHVAHRKLGNLLEHGGRVVLVAPEVRPEIRDLEGDDHVEIRPGRYEPGLLEELAPFLVYAATDDDELNRRIAADAAERGILSSSVSSWQQAGFISPSVIRWGRGQVSVTTEGASCRQAKFMRLRLENLLGGERELLVVGVDVRSLSLEEFERVRPDAQRIQDLESMLSHLASLEEFAVLATCNRLEVYAWTRWEKSLTRAVLRVMGLDEFIDRIYVKTGPSVIEHAANVVSGHFSSVACETQITCQWKEAYRRAFDQNFAGVHLQNLHDRVLRLGKRLRASHEAAAAGLPEMVAEEVGREDGSKQVLVIGAGALGREVAVRLSEIDGVRLNWANRTLDRIPEEPACPRLPLEQALARLGAYDVVVSVLGAAEPVIRPEHLHAVESPPRFIDLGMPRNVDGSVAKRKGVRVLCLSDFRNAGVDRERLLRLAKEMIVGCGGSHV
jgi:glutamyl-tRNA reductase